MSLPDFCIKNPVVTVVISLVIILLGLIAYTRLSITGYPNISLPQVGVHTTLSGASASYMENQVSAVIEAQLANLTGVDFVESSSQPGVSDVLLQFKHGVNINQKVNEISNALAKVSSRLPHGIVGPEVHAANPNETPIISVFIADDKHNITYLTDYIKRYIQPQLQRISGVATVNASGSHNYAVRMWLEPAKMATLQVTVEDVINAIKSQNTLSQNGEIKTTSRTYPLIPDARINRVNDFNHLIISHSQNKNIRFDNIGSVGLGSDNNQSFSTYDGKKGVSIGVVPASNANPLEVAQSVYQSVKMLEEHLPEGMSIKVAYDLSLFLQSSIDSVYESLWVAAALVVLIVFIFLGSLRASLIPLLTLPICLIGTFFFIYLFGFTLNIISLLALVLAIGLIVDDAIVILENSYRYIQSGLPARQAAFKGTNEVVWPVIAISLTLVAVYAPLGLSQGLTGQLFWQFALTLIIAVVLSSLVALTLAPMLCAYWLSEKENKFQQNISSVLNYLSVRYRLILSYCLSHRKVIIAGFIFILIAGYGPYRQLPSELAPVTDQGYINIHFNGPTNVSASDMQSHVKSLGAVFAKQSNVSHFLINSGEPNTSQGQATLLLKPWGERKQSQEEISQQLAGKLSQIPGINAVIAPPPPLGIDGQGGFSLELVLMTPRSYQYLNQVATDLLKNLAHAPGLQGVTTNVKWDNFEYRAQVNRALAADLGVDTAEVTNTLSVLMGGYQAGDYYYNGYPYDIILQALPNHVAQLSDLQNIYVKTASDTMVPVSTLVNITQSTEPTVLANYNQLHSLHIMANLKSGVSMSDAISKISTICNKFLPDDVSYQFFGQTKSFLSSKNDMAENFILAIIFIYLFLAAQFGCFIQPLIILTAVPVAMAGAIFALSLTKGSLNLFSEIGLITLVGLISKHGILIIDIANKKLAEGYDKFEAILEAAQLRLRPILMTTMTMVLGALPLIFHGGAGAESRMQLGIVIVGGLVFGTFCTLVVVPVFYSLFSTNRIPALSNARSEEAQS
ncbi:efflux RND transporter permease subunit [Piscirickettsia salmonis]|uniref:efflux RND transporter permease subunit n=1 Tax=Piscirickettsia salmonis TaxID=1238 RepID=UPI003752C8A1